MVQVTRPQQSPTTGFPSVSPETAKAPDPAQVSDRPTVPAPDRSPSRHPFSEPSQAIPWQQRWVNLNFRTRLTVLLVVTAAIPVVAVTQGMTIVARNNLYQAFQEALETRGQILASEYVGWTQSESASDAVNIATQVESAGIDLSRPDVVADRLAFLQSLVNFDNGSAPESNKNFKIIVNAQGRSVVQRVLVQSGDFTKDLTIPDPKDPVANPAYSLAIVPGSLDLTTLPIVQSALGAGTPQTGIETLSPELVAQLRLQQQVEVLGKDPPTQGLAISDRPAPPGTYPLTQGQVALTGMAVYPIKLRDRLVGAVIIGSVMNHNHALVDKFRQQYTVKAAAVFLQDLMIATDVPYPGTPYRAVGTRSPAQVAHQVIQKGQAFVGPTDLLGQEYLAAYLPLKNHRGETVGMAFVGQPLATVDSALLQQLQAGYGIGIMVLLVVGLVVIPPVARTIARPLRQLTEFAQRVGAGELGTRLADSERSDEIGLLSRELNQMAANLEASFDAVRQQDVLQSRIAEQEQGRMISEMTLLIRQTLQQDEILRTTVQRLQALLKADRVLVIRLDPQTWEGRVIAEWVGDPQLGILGTPLEALSLEAVGRYQQGQGTIISDLADASAGLTLNQIDAFSQFGVRSVMTVPILLKQQLFGLLEIQHCRQVYPWPVGEVNMVTQVATQVGIALEQAQLLLELELARQEADGIAQTQIRQREQLQSQLLQLLRDIEASAKGDLTVRADVTAGEIGTVADFFNAIIESLRQIVTQVKQSALQVNASLGSNERAMQTLATAATQQAQGIVQTLDALERMTQAIQGVATNAQQAATIAHSASLNAEVGGAVMNRTVDSILTLQGTIAEAASRVKRLGEASQQISKVVALINRISLQTKLLAVNASIEAARSGEEGQGFEVVAKQVGQLAAQSTQATREIEHIVAAIRQETQEVVAAMELGTVQVTEGTQLVEETKQSLGQIVEVSRQIDQLVETISQTALEQAETSQGVTQLIQDIAQESEATSQASQQVSLTLKQTVEVAKQLQASVGIFKVESGG